MVSDSSLVGGGPSFGFDFETQKGIMILLAAVRASELSSEQKNELRDLAFLYSNGGHDQSVRIMLEQKVRAAGLKAPAPISNTSASAVPPPPFGTSRPAPTFSYTPSSVSQAEKPKVSSPVPPVVATPVAAQIPAEQKPVTPVLPTQENIETEFPAANPVISASVPVPEPTPIPVVVDAAPETFSQPEPLNNSVSPAPVEQVIVAPSESKENEFPEVDSYDPEQSMQRIREIKSLVNEQVGNPVNLVDINNEVGREYMAALLDAMKKINSGSMATSAMRRLEESFKIVQKTLADHANGTPTTSPSAATIEEPVSPQPIIETKEAPEEVLQVLDTTPEIISDADVSALKVNAEEVAEDANLVEELVSTPESTIPTGDVDTVPTVAEMPIQNVAAVAEAPIPSPITPISELEQKNDTFAPVDEPVSIPAEGRKIEVESSWGPATDTLASVAKTETLSSLAASEHKLRTPSELPEASELSTASIAGDPLSTRDVDDGLQQLLSEWSLFKKSGLFGTGPKGREHPLFKKIAGLQIPLLLAGRFEGATQEIKQSITDYMNGWRYEQGIIYEPGETFEHYLRRVIRHILDLQKKKQRS